MPRSQVSLLQSWVALSRLADLIWKISAEGAALVSPFSVFGHLPARTDEVFE